MMRFKNHTVVLFTLIVLTVSLVWRALPLEAAGDPVDLKNNPPVTFTPVPSTGDLLLVEFFAGY